MPISISWPSLATSWVVVQKICSKMYLVSCFNIHRDVTDSVNHGMVKNTKTWISWERNIIFLRNKKDLNTCLSWHILRSYRFVAEVTFKVEQINHNDCYKAQRFLFLLLLKLILKKFQCFHYFASRIWWNDMCLCKFYNFITILSSLTILSACFKSLVSFDVSVLFLCGK